MNQLNPGNNSDVLPNFPVKRKRGRPRKDQSLNRREGPQVPPGFKVVNRIQPLQLDAIEVANDGIVGQTVTGVVEAVFDDGYLLNVRIGNSNTNLRGVIFKPGHYVPISAENDVAPHVQMIRRNEIPLQMENQTHMHARHPQSKDLHGVPTGHLANRSPPGIRIAPQTADLVASKGKHVSPVSSCVVPFVGGRGTLVPVVLQPVSLSNGFLPPNQVPQIPSQVGHLAAPKHIQVQTVPSQVPHLQPQTSHQVPRVDVRNENGPFHQGAEVLYGEQVKSMKQIGVSLETHIKNNMNEPLVVEPLQAIHSNIHNHSEPVPKPSEKNRIGRMSELLQGSMTAPYYNSRATKMAVVTNGEGYFEMACPHLSSSEFGGSGSSRGRQEGAEDRTSSNGVVFIRKQWPKLPESEWPPEPWCGVYRSPRSPSHHHRFQESKSTNCLLRRQCSEQ